MLRYLVAGAVIGALLLGLVRFVAVPLPQATHYHANWQVVIKGERLDLTGSRYMEDVAACAAGHDITPVQRVHMHNGEDAVVHVHHDGVAWGHLLQNLGFAAAPDYLILDGGRRFFEADSTNITYVVNGFVVDDIRTRMIQRGDRLLISVGPGTGPQVLAEQFPLVPDDAPAYDTMQDPASCAGAADATLLERLRYAFWPTTGHGS